MKKAETITSEECEVDFPFGSGIEYTDCLSAFGFTAWVENWFQPDSWEIATCVLSLQCVVADEDKHSWPI